MENGWKHDIQIYNIYYIMYTYIYNNNSTIYNVWKMDGNMIYNIYDIMYTYIYICKVLVAAMIVIPIDNSAEIC